MTAEKPRMRQVEEPGLIGEYQPAALLVGGPMLAGHEERRTEPSRRAFDDQERAGILARHHDRHAVFQNAGLFPRDVGERRSEMLGVIDGDRRDQRDRRPLDYVGGVEGAREA